MFATRECYVRPRKLSGDDLVILASKWLTVDTEGKKNITERIMHFKRNFVSFDGYIRISVR